MSAGTAKLLAHLWSPEPWGLPHVTGTGLGYVWRGDTRTTAEPALVLAHGPPRWHCWWAPEPWVSQLLGLSIAAYFLCCQPGTKEEWLHLWHPPGARNQPRVRKAESGQEICNPGSFTQEEVVPFYQSMWYQCSSKSSKEQILGSPGAPLILPMETAAHLGFLLRAWGIRDGSLQLECLPHWRITHSIWVPASSQMAGWCLTGLGLLLQVQICESWHIPFSCEQQSPSCTAKHAGECPPLHLAFSWGHLIHGLGQAHRMSPWCGHHWPVTRERKKEKRQKVIILRFWLAVFENFLWVP